MVEPSDYAEPQLLQSLIEDVLTEEEALTFRALKSLSPASRDVENLRPEQVILKNRWEDLKRVAGERIKDEVRSLGHLSIFGWLENGPGREPLLLDSRFLRSAEFLAYDNEIRAPDGVRYRSCLVVLGDAVSRDQDTYMVNSKPLYFWHERPPASWYRMEVKEPRRRPGRPRKSNLTAAEEEAERREALGEATADANAAAAEQFGVTTRQLRDRRKLSRLRG